MSDTAAAAAHSWRSDVSDNRLTELPADLFSAQSPLNVLFVPRRCWSVELNADCSKASGNRLNAVPAGVFALCPQLREVSVKLLVTAC